MNYRVAGRLITGRLNTVYHVDGSPLDQVITDRFITNTVIYSCNHLQYIVQYNMWHVWLLSGKCLCDCCQENV